MLDYVIFYEKDNVRIPLLNNDREAKPLQWYIVLSWLKK